MSSSRSCAGSSSTTMAMFCIALRKRRGIECSASATSCSNAFRSTPGRCGLLATLGRPLLRRLAVARPRDDEPEVVAVVANRALVAKGRRPADAAAMKDQRVRGARPSFRRQGGAELLFHFDRIVAFGDADAIGNPQD